MLDQHSLAPRLPLLTGAALLLLAASIARDGPEPAASLERGRELYAQHCAVCHGETGDGRGQAAYLLSPAPRDFSEGLFRVASTWNGVPTDADLAQTLRRGMPGSSMPPWEWLPERDLQSLVLWVRELTREGAVRRLLEWAEWEEEELTREEALAIVEPQLVPGEPIPPVGAVPGDPITLQEGRRIFVRSCASCHGADGTGRGADEQRNADGTPVRPRDLTAGVFKGGASPDDIARRVLAGMPGSPMPQTRLEEPGQVEAVVAYALSLARPGAQERALQRRQRLVAGRVAELPAAPTDPAWAAAEAAYLPLMPLWWSDARVEGVAFRALHDGRRLAVRLTWADPCAEAELLDQAGFSDAAALQWSAGPDPPLFTMGSAGKPCNLWQWKAAWERDRDGPLDVADRYPHTPDDQYGVVDAPSSALYRTATAAGNTQAAATRPTAGEVLAAEGFGTLAPIAGRRGAFEARGVWADGTWDVVFTRALPAGAPAELALEPGREVFVAGAVWNGAAGERNGQKAVTVWHVLHLEP